MKPITIVRIVIGLCVAVPMVALNLGVLGVAAATEEALAGVEGTPTQHVAPRGLAGVGRAIIGKGMEISQQRRAEATFDVGSYTPRRVVSIEQTLPITDFLAPGEAAPSPDLALLWAAARAPRVLMQACDLALQTVARGCAYGSSEVQRDKETGDIRLKGTLMILPSDDPGDMTGREDWALERHSVRLPRDRAVLSAVQPADLPAARLDLMRAAQAECDKLRAETGTCVLTSIGPRERPARNGTLALSATVTMAWLRAPAALDDLAAVEAANASGGFLAKYRRSDVAQAGAAATPAESGAKVVITKGGNALNTGRTLKPGENRHFRSVETD